MAASDTVGELGQLAEALAEEFTSLLRATVANGASLLVDTPRDDHRRIRPSPHGARITLEEPVNSRHRRPELDIDVELRMARNGVHLATTKSRFSLWVVREDGDKAQPLVRLEYERSARSKPPSHGHAHLE